MQYYAPPSEMIDAARERHEMLLREAEWARRVHLIPSATPSFTMRLAVRVQSMARAGKERWQQARTIFKLAPVE